MDASKTPSRTNRNRDNFLFDAVHPKSKGVSVGDGFRFGIGFFVAHLLLALIVGGLAWAIVVAFDLHA